VFIDPYSTELGHVLLKLISESNGVSLADTLDLASQSMLVRERPEVEQDIKEFRGLVFDYHRNPGDIKRLLDHSVAKTLGGMFRAFPLPFREEHIHLTGSLSADFIYPRLAALLEGPDAEAYRAKITATYGPDALPINSEADVDRLIRLSDDMGFTHYLQILTLAKLVLVDREAHRAAAYHMASKLNRDYNIGRIRLKFSFSRATRTPKDALPGPQVSSEDVVLGLYEGFAAFQSENPGFDFILSPSFRKETDFFDPARFGSKRDSFLSHVKEILALIDKHPFLGDKMTDIDTVGDERGHYRKVHFEEMRLGMRKLHSRGFSVRSHHGETWRCLRRGVQAVDNAMNIWHIDTLEHGISLGVNPNYFFHMVFERVMALNAQGKPVPDTSLEYRELCDLEWREHDGVLTKLKQGIRLAQADIRRFINIKFHAAREIEHYQHDVLNRMINKNVSLVALPSSNVKLTGSLPTYKDHPFSWWEKKGVELAVGTDNYVTLNTNFLHELLILLVTDADDLKITKLLMVVTGETRRPYMSNALWSSRPEKRSPVDRK
jgi:adenosine deaminase